MVSQAPPPGTATTTDPSARPVPTRTGIPRRRHTRTLISTSAWNIVGLLVGLVMIFPVYWMVASSFKTGVNLRRVVPQWFPSPFTLDSYARALQQPRFLGSLFNSLIVVGTTALASVVIGFLAALALARTEFTGRKALIVLVITAFGLILAYLSFVLPFTVWMLRGFIAAVPKDLEEAAMVDGCTRGQAVRKIIVPLAAPGLVATTVFSVIQAWNEYLFAYVLIKQNTKQTITVWLDTFITTKGVDWGALMAASTLVAVPIVVLFALIQKRVASGLTAGAVKG
jgi:N,N'-diacetylchitobiose transport system permease protein